MEFGRLTTKWRIFHCNLDFSVKKNSLICHIAAKLHNYVIDNDNMHFKATYDAQELGIELIDKGPQHNRGYLAPLPVRSKDGNVEDNRRVEKLETRDMKWPVENIVRNNELDDVSIYALENLHVSLS